MRGIYKIENKINGKVYIGESLDIDNRIKTHIRDLNNNKHHSYKLQEDWNKYGKDNFNIKTISILDKTVANYIDRIVLIIYEDKYINKYDSINTGYNIENTLEVILKGEKSGFNPQDVRLIKAYKNDIDNGRVIIEVDNVVYRDRFSLHFIEKRTKIEHDELINRMLGKDMLVELDKKDRYILNENYFNKTDMICNGKSGIAFKLNIYNKIISDLDLKI